MASKLKMRDVFVPISFNRPVLDRCEYFISLVLELWECVLNIILFPFNRSVIFSQTYGYYCLRKQIIRKEKEEK